jgi:salicylate hydroxylase
LQAWGLEDALRAVAAYPERLEVKNAMNGQLLGVLPLGRSMVERYGAAYASIARPDMHALLLHAVEKLPNVKLHLSSEVTIAVQEPSKVLVQASGISLEGDALIGADGVWSRMRALVVNDGAPRVTGHLAFRTLVNQADLPQALRSQVVTAWMGHDFHVIQYPVRRGEQLNVVAIVHGEVFGDPKHWDHSANALELQERLKDAHSSLKDLIHCIADWRLWALSDRPPMRSAQEHVRGRIALLGDAAHPMRPYLAQGAGMAIEDAYVLNQELRLAHNDVPGALQRYAQARWQRNARVQSRAIRNGSIYHLQGPVRMGRDIAIRLMGERLLNVPWLYQGI